MAYRKNGLRIEDLHSVKIDGLTEFVRTEEIEEAFSKFGVVQDIYVPRDFRTQRNKGFGFVRFELQQEAEDAAQGRVELDGERVELCVATKPKRDGPPLRKGDGKGADRGGRDDYRDGGRSPRYYGRSDRGSYDRGYYRDDRGRNSSRERGRARRGRSRSRSRGPPRRYDSRRR